MTAKPVTYRDRREWLQARRGGIGGSEVGAILGFGYGDAYEVLSAKLYGTEIPQTEPMRWGTLHEPTIARAWAEDHPQDGHGMTDPGQWAVWWHKDHPWAFGTPDRLIYCPEHEGQGVLEIKTAHPRSKEAREEWGAEMTDQVPTSHLLQVQWYLMCLGLTWGRLAVLLDGCEMREYHLDRNEALIGNMVELVGAWWQRHVVELEPLDVDGSESCRAYLLARYPGLVREGKPPLLAGTMVTDDVAYRLRDAEAARKSAEAEEESARQQLMQIIGDEPGIEGDGYRIRWTTVAASATRRGHRKFMAYWPKPKEGE